MKKNTKEKIVEAAGQLLEQEGIEGLTMRKIAKNTGLALGTLYNYFPNKDHILLALVEDFWARGLKRLDIRGEKKESFMEAYLAYTHKLTAVFIQFHQDWLGLMGLLGALEKKEGLKLEREMKQRLYGQINQLLSEYYPTGFKKLSTGQLGDFISSVTLWSLREGQEEIDKSLPMLQILIQGAQPKE